MKKVIAFIVTCTLALTALAGCGRMGLPGDLLPSERPAATASPAVEMPRTDDGIVRDEDGIITDDDTGTAPTPDTGKRDNNGMETPSASPSASPAAKK